MMSVSSFVCLSVWVCFVCVFCVFSVCFACPVCFWCLSFWGVFGVVCVCMPACLSACAHESACVRACVCVCACVCVRNSNGWHFLLAWVFQMFKLLLLVYPVSIKFIDTGLSHCFFFNLIFQLLFLFQLEEKNRKIRVFEDDLRRLEEKRYKSTGRLSAFGGVKLKIWKPSWTIKKLKREKRYVNV